MTDTQKSQAANTVKKFFFNNVIKQGGQAVLKEAGKLLGKLKVKLGNITISPIVQYKSNNGITIGQDWRISVSELGERMSDLERDELGKFSKLLMETFTKNGGAMKSTAYVELERNVMMKKARETISRDAYRFILEKIPTNDRSTWLAALVIKSQMQAGAYTLANSMQQQLLLLKGKTGMVIGNLMMDGFLEKTLMANYDIFTKGGQELSGEKAYQQLYQQIVHDIPNATNAWGYTPRDLAKKEYEQSSELIANQPQVATPVQKNPQPQLNEIPRQQRIILDTVSQVDQQVSQKSRLGNFKPLSLQEQIEKAKIKIESLGQKLSRDHLPPITKMKDLS